MKEKLGKGANCRFKGGEILQFQITNKEGALRLAGKEIGKETEN